MHLEESGLANKENVPVDVVLANMVRAPVLEVIHNLVREIHLITHEAHHVEGKHLFCHEQCLLGVCSATTSTI